MVFFLSVYLEKSCISYVNLAESQLSMRCDAMEWLASKEQQQQTKMRISFAWEPKNKNDAPKRK